MDIIYNDTIVITQTSYRESIKQQDIYSVYTVQNINIFHIRQFKIFVHRLFTIIITL